MQLNGFVKNERNRYSDEWLMGWRQESVSPSIKTDLEKNFIQSEDLKKQSVLFLPLLYILTHTISPHSVWLRDAIQRIYAKHFFVLHIKLTPTSLLDFLQLFCVLHLHEKNRHQIHRQTFPRARIFSLASKPCIHVKCHKEIIFLPHRCNGRILFQAFLSLFLLIFGNWRH